MSLVRHSTKYSKAMLEGGSLQSRTLRRLVGLVVCTGLVIQRLKFSALLLDRFVFSGPEFNSSVFCI